MLWKQSASIIRLGLSLDYLRIKIYHQHLYRTQSVLYSVTDYATHLASLTCNHREAKIYANITEVPPFQKSKLPAEA